MTSNGSDINSVGKRIADTTKGYCAWISLDPASRPVPMPPVSDTWQQYLEMDNCAIAAGAASRCREIDGLLLNVCGEMDWSCSPFSVHEGDDLTKLVTAYREFGIEFCQWLRGFFSLVLIDPIQQRVVAVTDRFATESLYFRTDDKSATIAPRPEPLLNNEAFQLDTATPQALYDYCYFHVIPAGECIYPALDKLPGAHRLVWDASGISVAPYQVPEFSGSGKVRSQEELSKTLRERLKASVQHCLGSHQQPGAFLSGGLDSSSVVGFMAESSNNGKAYSIGFDAEGYDEMAYARIAAQHFGVELKEYYVTPNDVVAAFPALAAAAPEPFGNSSLLPAYYCARMAQQDGVDVMLAGDGGDELFAGNERYLRQQAFDHYLSLPRVVRRAIDPLAQCLPDSPALARKIKSYIAQANTPLPDRLQSYNFLHRIRPEAMFEQSFLQRVDLDAPLQHLRRIYQRPREASDLHRMLYHDWQNTLADNDLRKVGLACQAADIEVKYPMLAEALVDLACELDASTLLAGGKLRAFYKTALSGWLPEEILKKQKHGFGLPFGLWMRTHTPLRDLIYDAISRLEQRGIFRNKFLDEAVRLHREGHASYYGELLWILSSLEYWLEARS